MSDLDLDVLLEDAADRRDPDVVELIAEVRALRGRVAMLESAVRDHSDCRICSALLDGKDPA